MRLSFPVSEHFLAAIYLRYIEDDLRASLCVESALPSVKNSRSVTAIVSEILAN